MAEDCGVTGAGAGVCGGTGAVAGAAGGVAFTGMNSGPFWPQPVNVNNRITGSNMVVPQITGRRYDANISFTIKIRV